jgi:hypothetical protein
MGKITCVGMGKIIYPRAYMGNLMGNLFDGYMFGMEHTKGMYPLPSLIEVILYIQVIILN